MRKTSEKGISFIKAREGFCPTIKPDGDKYQIGHGHNLSKVEIASKIFAAGINLEQGDALLRNDLASSYEPSLDALAPQDATENEFDAVISFGYNEGIAGMATMLHHGWTQVPAQMPAWHWKHVGGVLIDDKGLAARRALEVAFFNS